MKFWKPLTKYRYSKERNEVKYHTDFMLDKEEGFELRFADFMFKEKVPKDKVWKCHLELAVEEFNEK